MHRWRSDKIGILMDFSYQWRSSQWVLLFRTAKQKALLLKKQRREWSNYTYLRQKLVIISSLDLPGTTYPTRMIHTSMPPESDPKIFCCYRDRDRERERAIPVDFQASSCDMALWVGSDSPTRCILHHLPRLPPPPPLRPPHRCPQPPSPLHPPSPRRFRNLQNIRPLHLEKDGYIGNVHVWLQITVRRLVRL